MDGFADAVIDWFETHGRHDLPWQANPSPYRVWVSEIMLQQTRVATVIPFFNRFMQRFPDVNALAAADIDQVLHLWTGLGYYARARNLHKVARTIAQEHDGKFPGTVLELERLSGIGRSTAGAILALAHDRPAPILDGNVKRVLARCFAIEGYPGNSKTQSRLWTLAEALTPPGRVAAYTQGMMDLGATLCTRANPDCPQCPLQGRCRARKRCETERFPGKKPAKTLPVRSVTMLILQDREGRVLLEKRPPNGVWGSLYSLPQFETNDETNDGTPTNDGVNTNYGTPTDVSVHVGARHASPAPRPNTTQHPRATHASPLPHELPAGLPALQFEDAMPQVLAPIRHGFTHFRMDITPIRHMVARTASAVADSDRWLWYSIAEPVEVGLAAPVRKLLAALATSE